MTDIQREGDALLASWGRYARKMSEALGYPRTSCISMMIDSIKVADRKARKQKAEDELTAKGKQKKSRKPIDGHILPDDFMKIDRIVSESPNHMQKVLRRAYLWGQPDRIAARELRIDRELFTEQREMAVLWVMNKFT